ncbi:glycerate kinase [uncultured Aquimarina sp.]|uniref:glycerate kinase n=1 Tax=uncultured Aquimarina sp. TaxID=575652 RepID=UPI0026104463|nr:glycerate kinase [uncultured Aquimarina sp.]
MKIVLAPDKFKNSLTAMEFCLAVERGIKSVKSDVDIVKLPLADGGDGTIEVVNYYLNGETVTIEVNDPFFKPIKASYLYSETSQTAFIEMAEASGMKLLKEEQFDCKNATTYGTGEMILDVINKGATKVILGLGGSATNDCGIGMAAALGYQFLDKKNQPLQPIGANLSKIASINTDGVTPKLSHVQFQIACDVTNPLYGKNGAAFTYAAQKGANSQDIEMLDKGLQDFSVVLRAVFNVEPQSVQGAGAAGGMGIASKVFLKGTLEPGIELIKKLAGFNEKIEDADWIISGEGKLDDQTLLGKTIQGVTTAAKDKNIKVAVFCGIIELNEDNVTNFNISYVDEVIKYATGIKDAMSNADHYLEEIAKKFMSKF